MGTCVCWRRHCHCCHMLGNFPNNGIDEEGTMGCDTHLPKLEEWCLPAIYLRFRNLFSTLHKHRVKRHQLDMFDSTGIIEVFVSRLNIPSQNPACHRPRSPSVDTYNEPSAQTCFNVCFFLTERFDWMGERALCVSFVLDDGATVTELMHASNCVRLPAQARGEEIAAFRVDDFASLQRHQMVAATLEYRESHQPAQERLQLIRYRQPTTMWALSRKDHYSARTW